MPRKNHPKSGRRPQAPKGRRPIKRRNIVVLHAKMKTGAGPMKDRRAPRGGSGKKDWLKEYEDD